MRSWRGGLNARSYGVNDPVTEPASVATPAKDRPEEGANNKVLADFLTKLSLRVFNSCPLLSGYMLGQYCHDGVIEMAFHEPPATVVTQLVTIFGGCPYETFKFSSKTGPCLGFRLKPRPEDLSDIDAGKLETPPTEPENGLLEPKATDGELAPQ